MKEKNKSVLVTSDNKSVTQMNAETLIAQAISQNVPVETMEKLLAMRRELKAEWAKEQFDQAMANFQAECPVIVKSKAGGQTQGGQVAYHYAPLDTIVKETKDLIQKNGFSYLIKTKTETDKVTAICIAKHKSGHSEESSMEVPLGAKTGVMSNTQVVAAAITFAKRYAFMNVFGILTGDEDVDAMDNKKKKPTGSTVIKAQIISQLKALGVNTADKEQITVKIKALTGLDGVTDDIDTLESISDRLSILIQEKNENN